MRRFSIVILVFLAIAGVTAAWPEAGVRAAGDEYAPVQVAGFPDGVYAEIRPEVELLSGVLSQTSWIERRGPRGEGNTYFRELKAFFAPHKDSDAVKAAERLTQLGFAYDAPPNFAVSLGPLPEMAPVNGFSDYLVKRARGKGNLERFRLALADLARKSGFAQFFAAHRPDYERFLAKATKGFRSTVIIGWLREFGGTAGDEYHLVLAPAMFPGGGYGVTVHLADGRSAVYQIIRESGAGTAEPQFVSGIALESLALHEWGHSIINPALEKHARLVKKLEPLFRPVEDEMRKQAYGSVAIFLNEQVLRAMTSIACGELYGAEARKLEIAGHTRNGFYLTEFTVAELERYRAERNQYPTFEAFAPVLLKAYREHMDELIRLASK